jgi:hypothetical protein
MPATPRSRANRLATNGKSGGSATVRIVGTNTGESKGNPEIVGMKRDSGKGTSITRNME